MACTGCAEALERAAHTLRHILKHKPSVLTDSPAASWEDLALQLIVAGGKLRQEPKLT